MTYLEELLAASAALHHHLCPRQVLGVRLGIAAGRLLGLDLPRRDKRLLTIVETDGCFTDGVAVATGCSVGRRTLRVEDFGKVAATFVDTGAGQSVRLTPSPYARASARQYAPEAHGHWEAYLIGYQRMPDSLLLSWQWVTLQTPIETIVSRAGKRAICQVCHEEIINEREVIQEGLVLCRACAGQAYYTVIEPPKQAMLDIQWLCERQRAEVALAP